MKKYESNDKVVGSVFDLELINANGELNKFYVLNDDVKNEMSLRDLINSQIVEVKSNTEDDSGNNSQLATSGNYSRLATSGNNSQLATSGNNSQLATSGYCSQLATSGYCSRLATSGDYSRLATSGNYSQLATSGYNSQLATSGNNSRLATSGDYSRLATSGNYSRLATSGDYSRLEIKGNKSIGFACGNKSTIKAINGTWISLAEYSDNYEPIFALSAQIGNDNYKDCYDKTLSENETYMLINKQFTPVVLDDGLTLIKIHSKFQNDMEVIKCKDFDDDEMYCVRRNNISAHGETLKSAIDDLIFKELKNRNIDEVIENIKSTKVVTRNDYRAITGACQFGTEEFCKENDIVDLEEIELDRLLLLLDDKYYDATKFKDLFR